jgi:hypothetical protein
MCSLHWQPLAMSRGFIPATAAAYKPDADLRSRDVKGGEKLLKFRCKALHKWQSMFESCQWLPVVMPRVAAMSDRQ